MYQVLHNSSFDYKSDKNIQETIFDNDKHLLLNIIKEFNNLRRYEFIAIYTSKKKADILKNKLAKLFDVEISDDKEIQDEWCILTLAYDGNIFIDSMYLENKTVRSSGAIINYLDNDCNTIALVKLSTDDENVLIYRFENE